jgi:Polyketide cyclase / dehydrase and lipid transport
LPEWNDAIESVVERPTELAGGSEWVVKMHPSRLMTWKSRSRVDEFDREAMRFAYRTTNEDGNPSYASWKWTISRPGPGANIAVSWDVYLKTLDRKLLAGPIRQRQLRKEVAASLRSIDHVALKR